MMPGGRKQILIADDEVNLPRILGVQLQNDGYEVHIVGDGRTWDQVRFNVFPSKAAFMAVALDPERLAAQADHREVAIADTYTFIIRPQIDRIAELLVD